jgi:hypothetical protein
MDDDRWCPLFGRLPEPGSNIEAFLVDLIQQMRRVWDVPDTTLEHLERAHAYYTAAPAWVDYLEAHRQAASEVFHLQFVLPATWVDPTTSKLAEESLIAAILAIHAARHALSTRSQEWTERAIRYAGEARKAAAKGFEPVQRGRREGARKAGQARRSEGRRDDVLRLYKSYCDSGVAKHNIASMIARRLDISAQHVRAILRDDRKTKHN